MSPEVAASPLRVLHVINTLAPVGGAEVSLANLVNELPAHGVEPNVCAIFAGGRLTERMSIPSERIRVFGFPTRGYVFDVRNLAQMVAHMRQSRAHVVHTHLHAASLVGRLAAVLAGTPAIVTTEHNMVDGLPGRWAPAARMLVRRTNAIVAISPSIKASLERCQGIPPEKISVIPNGFPFGQATRRDGEFLISFRAGLGVGSDAHLVLCVARLTEQKGLHHLITAMAEVVRADPSCVLVLVGDGALRGDLEAQAAAIGIERQVRFTGQRTDTADLIQASNVVVMSSLWEGLPTILLEAHGLGKPIVATNVGGASDVVLDGVSGVLVPPSAPECLARGIVRILADSAQAGAMGKRGQTHVVDRFSIARTAASIAELYRAALAGAAHVQRERAAK